MEEHIHPKNVNPNVVGIRSQPGWLKIGQSDVNCSIFGAGCRVHRIDYHGLGCQLKEFWKVVQNGKQCDRNDKSPC